MNFKITWKWHASRDAPLHCFNFPLLLLSFSIIFISLSKKGLLDRCVLCNELIKILSKEVFGLSVAWGDVNFQGFLCIKVKFCDFTAFILYIEIFVILWKIDCSVNEPFLVIDNTI